MSFGNQNIKDRATLTPGGIQEEDMSTAQEGIPIPYLAGSGAISARWLCDPFAPDLVEIPSESGGKGASKAGGGAASGRYNAYGSIAGLLCHGPIDEVFFAETDNTRRWKGSMALGSINPAPLSLPDVGNHRIFIGDTNQPDWGLPLVSWSATPHPRYNGFAGFVADHILFGESREAPPSYRFGLRRRPRQALITGAAALLDAGQANPFAVLAELFISPRCGLGLPLSLFNQAAWQAAADAAYAKRSLTYVSLLLTSRQPAKSVAADMFVMCDGYWRVDRATGGCEVGVWPQAETIDTSTLRRVTYRGLIDPPDMEAQTLADVITRYTCNYTDSAENFKTRAVTHSDPGARGGLGQDRSENISRPQIARRAQALAHLQEYSRRRSLPGLSMTLPDRQLLGADVRPGTHIMADIDLEPGGIELEQVCRINSVSHPYSGVPTLKVEAERTLVPVPYTPAENPPPQEEEEVPDIAHASFFELPPQLSDGGEFAVCVLAERPVTLVTECSVYYDPANDTTATFPLLGSHRSFALRAELSSAANDGATSLAVSLLSPLSREIIASDPGPVAARNNDLLLILLHPYASGRALLEICSVDSMAATGADTLSVTVLRGRCGTAPMEHASATPAWFISRSALNWYRHNDFPARAADNRTYFIRLQPSTDSASRPLDGCQARSFLFDTTRAFAPVITVDNPASPASVEVNQAIRCSGSVSDADGNLVSLTILRSQGGLEEVLLDRSFAPGSGITFDLAAVAFTVEGQSALIIRAQDSTRRTVEKRVNVYVGASGSGGNGPAGKLLAPVLLESRCRYFNPYSSENYDYNGVSLPDTEADPNGNEVYFWDGPIYNNLTLSTIGWVRVKSSSVDSAPWQAKCSDPNNPSNYTAGTPAVEYLAAASSIGVSSPETSWRSIQVCECNNGSDGYNIPSARILNIPGGTSLDEYMAALGPSAYRARYYGDGGIFAYTEQHPCVGIPRQEPGVRIWVKAIDRNGVLTDSDIVYFDLYP